MTTQALVNTKQCTPSWTDFTAGQVTTYSFNKNAAYTGSLTGVVGIATNGVPIHAGTSELNFDFFAPKGTNSRRIEVDTCLGSNDDGTTANFYHYYSFSPCLFENSISNAVFAADCSTNSQCNSDYLKYSVTNLPTTQRVLAYTGIAKDGHMIVGPYKSAGALWQPCDVDACNGVTVNGEYVYASTLFFPYTVGCWGPATKQSQYAAGCSSNTNTCYSADSSSIFLQLSSMLMLLALALYMF